MADVGQIIQNIMTQLATLQQQIAQQPQQQQQPQAPSQSVQQAQSAKASSTSVDQGGMIPIATQPQTTPYPSTPSDERLKEMLEDVEIDIPDEVCKGRRDREDD